MGDVNLYSLMKFGSEENIYDLYNNGTIYLNTLEYFKKLEDNTLRGDSYEGVAEILNYPPGKLQLDFKDGRALRDLNYQSLHLRKTYKKLVGNIYSLYAIRPEHLANTNEFRPDLRNQEFGSHFLMIESDGLIEFLDKVFDELYRKGIPHEYGFVNYYSRLEVNRTLNIFNKPNDYAYQNEFRIYAQHMINEPLEINIGSLKHISRIFETKILSDFTIERQDRVPKFEGEKAL